MPKLIAVSPASPVDSESSEEIYIEKDENSTDSNRNVKKVKRHFTINITPLVSRLRKFRKPANHETTITTESSKRDTTYRSTDSYSKKNNFETKLEELERKAEEQLKAYNQRVSEENALNDQLRLTSMHNYKNSYADLSLAKKVLQTPNVVTYKTIQVSESQNKYEDIEKTSGLNPHRVASIKRYFSLRDNFNSTDEITENKVNSNTNRLKPRIKEAFLEPNTVVIKKTKSFSRISKQPSAISPIYYD